MVGLCRYGEPNPRRTNVVASCVGIVVALTALAVSIPGVALGEPSTPTLSSYIVSDPEPGWTEAPASDTESVVSQLQEIDSNAVNGESVPVAVDVWQSPDGNQLLAITLSQWPSNVNDLSQVPRTGLGDECVAVTGNNPTSIGSVPNISGSFDTVCNSTESGAQLAVTDALKGNDLEMVESIGIRGSPALSLTVLGNIAFAQYAALPSPAPSSPSFVPGTIGFALIIGVGVVVILFARRTRKPKRDMSWALANSGVSPLLTGPPLSGGGVQYSAYGGNPIQPGVTTSHVAPFVVAPAPFVTSRSPAFDTTVPRAVDPVPAPALSVGWHAETGNTMLQQYWDGNAWTARVQWNGSAWVEAN